MRRTIPRHYWKWNFFAQAIIITTTDKRSNLVDCIGLCAQLFFLSSHTYTIQSANFTWFCREQEHKVRNKIFIEWLLAQARCCCSRSPWIIASICNHLDSIIISLHASADERKIANYDECCSSDWCKIKIRELKSDRVKCFSEFAGKKNTKLHIHRCKVIISFSPNAIEDTALSTIRLSSSTSVQFGCEIMESFEESMTSADDEKLRNMQTHRTYVSPFSPLSRIFYHHQTRRNVPVVER